MWQKRGYSSKYGVVLVILVDTGEVVDFEVLPMHRYGTPYMTKVVQNHMV